MCAARIDSVAARERGLEAEAVVDERDVVVDRLRDADDRDPQLALGDHVGDPLRAVQRAVAADHEQDVDAELLQAVDDLVRVLLPARGAEDRAAVLVDVAARRPASRSITGCP